MWTIIMQSLNKKEWILLELQITQTIHPLSISDKFNTPQNWEYRLHKLGTPKIA